MHRKGPKGFRKIPKAFPTLHPNPSAARRVTAQDSIQKGRGKGGGEKCTQEGSNYQCHELGRHLTQFLEPHCPPPGPELTPHRAAVKPEQNSSGSIQSRPDHRSVLCWEPPPLTLCF